MFFLPKSTKIALKFIGLKLLTNKVLFFKICAYDKKGTG